MGTHKQPQILVFIILRFIIWVLKFDIGDLTVGREAVRKTNSLD